MSKTQFYALVASLLVVLVGAIGTGAWVFTQVSDQRAAVPALGGPYTLTDHTGTKVTDASWEGRYQLMYFGYTFCPDICPTSLSIMSDALDEMGPAASDVKPIFVTVDPERDTLEVLSAYHEHFHPDFSNLTGTAEEIAAIAKAYRVYYARVETDELTDYLMDHTSIVYLMSPDGRYVTHFAHDADPVAMANRLKEIVGS